MKSKSSTRPIRRIAGLLAGLLLATAAIPLGAQPARPSHPFYDIAKEVTLNGTVSSLIEKPAPGAMLGPHLVLTTASGEVDASLGKFALRGKNTISVAPGQQVEVTGVMKTVREKQVFLARVVKVNGQVYTLRTKYGVPMSPQSRERASQKTAQKGESL